MAKKGKTKRKKASLKKLRGIELKKQIAKIKAALKKARRKRPLLILGD